MPLGIAPPSFPVRHGAMRSGIAPYVAYLTQAAWQKVLHSGAYGSEPARRSKVRKPPTPAFGKPPGSVRFGAAGRSCWPTALRASPPAVSSAGIICVATLRRLDCRLIVYSPKAGPLREPGLAFLIRTVIRVPECRRDVRAGSRRWSCRRPCRDDMFRCAGFRNRP